MQRVLIFSAVCLMSLAKPARADEAIDTNSMTVASVLEDVRTRLPQFPVYISGRLETRKGRRKQSLNVEVTVNFSRLPVSGAYTISDSFGRTLEQLTISRTRDNAVTRTYSKGDPLKRSVPPKLSGRIQDTPVKWSDLALSFLWWRDGAIIGTDDVKGRPCIVMMVDAPKGEPTELRRAKLWIDYKYVFLMRAEEIGEDGTPLRRLSVKSFKKVRDEYMVKDIEIEDLKTKVETKLRIDELCDLAEKLRQ